LVVGGHEIRRASLVDEAQRLVTESRTVSPDLFARCKSELSQIDARLRPGTIANVGATIAGLCDAEVPRKESPREAVERLQQDLAGFAASEKLNHVIVVNVASTEPAFAGRLPPTWAELERLLDKPRACPLPASSLYAIAALDAGCSYINFTPSLGSAPAAIDELARLRGSRHYGCDGKTGETLLKSVLGPMFARRNLQVLSWVGHNIFGNLDGRVLNDPSNRQAKIQSKDHLLGEILGYRPQTHVSIEFIESLGDWKTAWDHVHFAGFLGVPMVLQFIWQGCDSVLAAPLVIDLVRLTEAAHRRGHVGAMPFLASFFKSPYGVTESRFDRQFQALEQWAAEKSGRS
jgi:myo-inositol-1-phosphate synthase